MNSSTRIATVTLNPAIDHTISIQDFKIDKVNRASSSQYTPGGKGVNVASMLSDTGLSVTVTGFLGTDNSGIFEHHFKSKRISDKFIRIPGNTRTGIKIIDSLKETTTDINFPGLAPDADSAQKLYSLIGELAADHDWFVLSGSVPEGVSESVYAEMVRLIKSFGKKSVLDTSGKPFSASLPQMPDIVKPNISELEEYAGKPLKTGEEVVKAAKGLLEKGIETVVISMGEKGAVFAEKDTMILAIPPSTHVVSTVGAGDAMVAGIVAGKIAGKNLFDTARTATAYSLCAISSVKLAIPSEETVMALAEKVRVETIK